VRQTMMRRTPTWPCPYTQIYIQPVVKIQNPR
jgi:hypothetical protein